MRTEGFREIDLSSDLESPQIERKDDFDGCAQKWTEGDLNP
jgi:hypothetical protein